ncbi:enhancer of zeste 2, partial [Dunaliella salina]
AADGSGVCTSNCTCVKNKNFCEKYCGCGPKCTNRFKGCRCTGQCRNRSCPCLAAGRECDPDLCRNCNAMCEGCAVPASECHNMRLRLRQHKRVVMGQSIVAGWGAFLHDGAKKGDFIGEYTGDLITQDEADRRGRIYDKINNSYLFNLNQEWVLDARHRGNKLRFANHSSDPNCKARILMVDGDHRVAIFAAKHIAPGDELFYDYRYQQEQAPVWAQGRD